MLSGDIYSVNGLRSYYLEGNVLDSFYIAGLCLSRESFSVQFHLRDRSELGKKNGKLIRFNEVWMGDRGEKLSGCSKALAALEKCVWLSTGGRRSYSFCLLSSCCFLIKKHGWGPEHQMVMYVVHAWLLCYKPKCTKGSSPHSGQRAFPWHGGSIGLAARSLRSLVWLCRELLCGSRQTHSSFQRPSFLNYPCQGWWREEQCGSTCLVPHWNLYLWFIKAEKAVVFENWVLHFIISEINEF